MKNLKIKINVEINSTIDMSLKVKMNIEGISDLDVLHLFRNKAKVSNLQSDFPMKEDKDFIHFNTKNNDIFNIEYIAHLGFFAKHGQYGQVSDDCIAFAGEQILLLPFECLNLTSTKGDFDFNLDINFDFKNNFKTTCIPRNSNNTTSILASTWGEMFEIMKSSYVFSNLNSYKINDYLNLYSSSDVDSKALENISKIYDYYKSLFKIDINLNINSIFLNAENKLFAGSSKTNICASFDFNNKRDLQLLSHRMFHAFMDTRLDNLAFHVPPNLWVTEGLATYYEHKALEVLDNDFKNKLSISFEEELKKLYRIYLYSLNKNEKLYNFPPIAEGNLQSHALIEYLHYTKSPLLIKFFEDSSTLDGDDKFINYLLSLETLENFSQPDMFKAILQDNINEFAINYIFGVQALPIDLDLTDDIEKIRAELIEFETVMSSWFELDKVKNDSCVTDENLKIFT